MAETKPWAFPDQLQPQQAELSFDLEAALQAVVLLHTEVPEDAFTASILGSERVGNGAVIRHGQREYILTIGYLLTEAESVWITTHDGQVLAGHPLAYDQVTGFGLILPLAPIKLPVLELGTSADLTVGDPVIVLSHGGIRHALNANLIAKREFAGYWEYLLDQALFTSPPHPHWSGAALLGQDGRLLGIGSLLAQEEVSGETFDANMFVPVDLLHPILEEMIQHGGVLHAPRPWLGVHTAEHEDRLVVAGLTENGPGDRAGLRAGDAIVEVAGRPVSTLSQFFRSVWSLGSAGVNIPLTLLRKDQMLRANVRSASRQDFLKKPQRH